MMNDSGDDKDYELRDDWNNRIKNVSRIVSNIQILKNSIEIFMKISNKITEKKFLKFDKRIMCIFLSKKSTRITKSIFKKMRLSRKWLNRW